MITINNFLSEKMRSLGAAAYKKFLCNEVIQNWSRLVDENIAAKVKPVTIEHGILFVDVKSSAYKDQLKFLSEDIIDSINAAFAEGEPLVTSIQIAKGFQVANMPPEKISEPSFPDKNITLEQITLSDEEIARCQRQVQKISDEKLRQTALQTLLSQARVQKFRVANGWHKCARCNAFCPPQDFFCETCAIKARAEMVDELFKIFYDEPWLKTSAAQKILLERMPHMRTECSEDAVESARTSLIQKVAGRVRFGDEESPDVLKLVMLEKRLPPDKLTPAIIRRTLIDLQFNLADQAKILRYNSRTQRFVN